MGVSVSCSSRLLKLRVGKFVSVIQSLPLKVGFCSRTKLVEGTIQENIKLPFEDERFNCGNGVVCEVQIPPVTTGSFPLTIAANLLPSAEEAIFIHCWLGMLLDTQVIPESAEVYMTPVPPAVPETAANFVPSAEDAQDHQSTLGELVC